MTAYPKHYLTDVAQELRLKVLDLCIHRQWHDALDLLHQNGFTQYEWYELVWFHDHAPTNLDLAEPSIRSADGPSALECGGSTPLSIAPDSPQRLDQNLNAEPGTLTPLETSTPQTETLTVGRSVPAEPNLNATTTTSNLNAVPVKVPKLRSKIGRLPKDIQDNLNAMPIRGRSYTDLIHWLNDQGYPGFNKVNLHTWKQKVSEGVQKPVEGDRR